MLNSLHHTIKAKSKIEKERVWINPVTSETTLQPLEQDTDAQLHEERVVSVRKEAEFAHRVLPARCPRWNADTLETSCRRDVKEFSGGDQSANTVQIIQKMSHSDDQRAEPDDPTITP